MTIDPLLQLLAEAKAGRFSETNFYGFNQVFDAKIARVIPYDEVKKSCLQNPEFRTEYERLRPNFEQIARKLKAKSSQKPHRTPKPRHAQRHPLMDFIPPQANGKNPLYAAVMFARELMREGQSPDYANAWAAKKYKVKKSDVAHYTGQVAGRVSAKRRAHTKGPCG